MARLTRFLACMFLLLLLLLYACAADPHVSRSSTPPLHAGGSFSLLTYNVDGLPAILKGFANDPTGHTPLIGHRVLAYDIVNVQEDFNSHAALYDQDDHRYRTVTSGSAGFGSGLNTLSRFPFVGDVIRVRWTTNSATDGNNLTPKGFTLQKVLLADQAILHVYNLHTNAGSSPEATAARRANILQLAEYVRAHSAGNALIIAGDTNCRYTRSEDNLRELAHLTGVTDCWIQLAKAGAAPAQGSPALVWSAADIVNDPGVEFVDKILYRSDQHLLLTPARYDIPDAAFRSPDGKMLSDHRPIAATFIFTVK